MHRPGNFSTRRFPAQQRPKWAKYPTKQKPKKKPQVEQPKPTPKKQKQPFIQEIKEEEIIVEPIPADECHLTTTPFPAGLACEKALAKRYKVMAQIQELCIPPLLAGRDVRGQAKTGSGKTLAFMLPAVELAIKHKEDQTTPIVVILQPLRELALQTLEIAEQLLGGHKDVRTILVGGHSNNASDAAKAHIIVATPGRLHSYVEAGLVDVSKVKLFVLDEVDLLLERGFLRNVRAIREKLPEFCQKALFSATMSEKVVELGDLTLDHLSFSTVTEDEVNLNSTCSLFYVNTKVKNLLPTLLQILRDSVKPGEATIVFSNNKHELNFYNQWATANGIESQLFTSALSHAKRSETFYSFRDKGGVIFASGLAGRGVDFPKVSTVVHVGAFFSVPEYTHKIGRTGRMGKVGRAILLLTPFHQNLLKACESMQLHHEEMEVTPVTPFPSVDSVPEAKRHEAYFGFIKTFACIPLVNKAFSPKLKKFAEHVFFCSPYIPAHLTPSKIMLTKEQVLPFWDPAEVEKREEEDADDSTVTDKKRKIYQATQTDQTNTENNSNKKKKNETKKEEKKTDTPAKKNKTKTPKK